MQLLVVSASKIPKMSNLTSQTLGSIINKLAPGSLEWETNKCSGAEAEKFISWVGNEVLEKLPTQGNDEMISNLSIVTWVTKGLVMRGHPTGLEFSKILCKGLKSSVGATLATTFEIIMGDSTEALNKECHAVIKVQPKSC